MMKSAFYLNVEIYDFANSKHKMGFTRKKNPWGFLGFLLSLEIPEKTSFHQ